MLQKISICWVIMIWSYLLIAQESPDFNLIHSESYLEFALSQEVPLNTIDSVMEAYFDKAGRGKGTGYKPYQRWKYWAERALNEKGIPILSSIAKQRAKAFHNQQAKSISSIDSFVDLGPYEATNTSTWSSHLGRLTGVSIDRSNPSHIVVSAPSGGVWKTLDHGQNWQALYDYEPILDVYAIEINPHNSNEYLAGTSGEGIKKSSDGGLTWSLTNGEIDGDRYNRILYHPTNSNIVLAIAEFNDQIYRSNDGGDNWTLIYDGFNNLYDLEFKPGNPNIVYASGRGEILKSTDAGQSFTLLTGPWNTTGAIMLAVTPDDPNYIYALQERDGGLHGIYRSTNEGISWTTQIDNSCSCHNYLGYNQNSQSGQAPRDQDIIVSPTDKNEIHIGGVETWASNDGAQSFYKTTDWVVTNTSLPFIHADIDILIYKGDTIFAGTDGGLFFSTDEAVSFTDITQGIGVRQFYRIGVSNTEVDRVSGGSQDNGTGVLVNGTWYDWLGADGMETFIDWSNKDIIYGTIQLGTVYKSVDGGQSRTAITQPPGGQGNWVTPFEQDPANSNTIYCAKEEVYKSTNGGSSWTTISSFPGTDDIDELKIAASNPDVMYLGEDDLMWKTVNGGANWTQVNLPVSFFRINYIAIHPTDEDRVLVALSGSAYKFAETRDGGTTWQDLTYNLPNISAECIIYDADNGLYAGMRPGIFYKDSISTAWTALQGNFPNVHVTEFEIAHQQLYISTYGRGLWKKNLADSTFGYLCSEARTINAAGCTDTISAPAISIGNSASQGDATNALWYSYTAPSNQFLTISSCGSSANTRLWIHQGDCNNLTLLDSSDNACIADSTFVASYISNLFVPAGQTIYLEWDDKWDSRPFQFVISSDGYTCQTASVIDSAGTYYAAGPSSCFGATESSATHANWFEFIPPESGLMSISSCNQGVDTRLWTYIGECGSFTALANNDDICSMGPGQSNWASEISNIQVYKGQSVWIQWDDRWSTSGFNFTISLVEDDCPPSYTSAGIGPLTNLQNHSAHFETDGRLESSQLIPAGTNVSYDSGMEIDLQPGFEVKQGAVFEAFIDGCGNLVIRPSSAQK